MNDKNNHKKNNNKESDDNADDDYDDISTLLGKLNYDVTVRNPLKGLVPRINQQQSKEKKKMKRQQQKCRKNRNNNRRKNNKNDSFDVDDDNNDDDDDDDNNNDDKDDDCVPHSLEFAYIGLNEVLYDRIDDTTTTTTNDTNNDTNSNSTDYYYDWTIFENMLEQCAKRNVHAIIRFFIHYPGKENLSLPQSILSQIQLGQYTNDKHGIGLSPNYTDPILLNIIHLFIIEFAKLYDGDHRIAYIQAGILGFWGEWHTRKDKYLLPNYIKKQVFDWYRNEFKITKIQIRSPILVDETDDNDNNNNDNNNKDSVSNKTHYGGGVGYHDDSYCFSTIDGDANGGYAKKNFFWPNIIKSGYSNFWMYDGPMGGEVRPELANDIFCKDYPSRTLNHQDFMDCVNATHTTYMKCATVFKKKTRNNNNNNNNNNDDNNLSESDNKEVMQKARYCSARMGYNFIVTNVVVIESTTTTKMNAPLLLSLFVDIDVTIQQVGVAPFYYPLDLILLLSSNEHMEEDNNDNDSHDKNDSSSSSNSSCNVIKQRVCGIEKMLVEPNTLHTFHFTSIGINNVMITNNTMIIVQLDSKMIYKNNPIKFAQGTDGIVSLPLLQLLPKSLGKKEIVI